MFRLGDVFRVMVETSRAIEVLDEALGIFRRRQAKERVGYVLLELGAFYSGRGCSVTPRPA